MSYYYTGCGCEPTYKTCDTSLDFIDNGSMSNYEKMCFIIDELEKVNGLLNDFQSSIDEIDNFQDDLDLKEDSINISNSRKLSPNGDFTGTITGKSQESVFADIDDALSLTEDLIESINNRESIGLIYDGGSYLDTEPPTNILDGGVY